MELEEVIFRQKHRQRYPMFDDEDLRLYVDDIVKISHQTKLNYLWRPFLKDSGDDKILETAFDAGAKHIITFNHHDFVGVEDYFDITIVSPKAYLGEQA
jgi:predicted nucleic acid-binding protein